MKTKNIYILMMLMLLTSCAMQKRRYSNGWYCDGLKKQKVHHQVAQVNPLKGKTNMQDLAVAQLMLDTLPTANLNSKALSAMKSRSGVRHKRKHQQMNIRQLKQLSNNPNATYKASNATCSNKRNVNQSKTLYSNHKREVNPQPSAAEIVLMVILGLLVLFLLLLAIHSVYVFMTAPFII
jgi:hypothetical protein